MKRKILLIPLMLLFLGVTVFAGVRLYQTQQEYRAGEQAYDALSQYVHAPKAEPAQPDAEPQPEQDTALTPPLPADEMQENLSTFPVVDFEGLQLICPDVVAWISMEDTVLSYPVVQAEDNSYYLRRLIDGSYNKAGSLFVDFENSADLSDRNTVIYGHNLKSGGMFALIAKYKKQSYYEAHPSCQIMTPQGNYTLEFFAGYVADLNDDAWKLDFKSDEEFTQWLEAAVDRSTFQSTVVPTAQDRVVTLSTCSYEFNDARYVLLGVLRPEQEA